MRKNYFKLFIVFCLLIPFSLFISGCGKDGNDDKKELTGTELNYIGAEQKETSEMGSILYAKYQNSKLVLSFSDYITVADNATWSVSLDIYGNFPIKSKVTNLEVGDNIYYILVTAQNGESQQYILLAHRNYLYTVTFDTGTDTQISSINIEEGNKVSQPSTKLTKILYTFMGWDWDFSQPITSNLTITAQWIRQEGSLDGDDVHIQVYFRYLTEEVEIVQPNDFQCEVTVEQGTKIGEILALAKIKDFINNVTIKNIEDAETFIESMHYTETGDNKDVIATFTTYYMREYPISNSGYIENSSLEVETNANYEINLEFYQIYFTFTLSYK